MTCDGIYNEGFVSISMPTVSRTVTFFQCNRCNHEWYPRRSGEPKTCPSCKSPYWDSERKNRSRKVDGEPRK